MELQKRIEHFIQKEKLFNRGNKLLIAVSGGVDSMVLTDLCKKIGVPVSIAHCNFQLRGAESEGDEHFVKVYAEKNRIPFFTKRFDVHKYAEEHKCGTQEAARSLRYGWFEELMKGNETAAAFDFLLTAHHSDDNVETMLMNFFKGTGINGLKGILPKNKKICRPLLFATKNEILAYATENKIEHREDSSNHTEKYTRNYFRHTVIPVLNEILPGVTNHLMHQSEKFRDIKTIYDQYCNNALEKLIEKRKDGDHIPVLKLMKMPATSTLLFEIGMMYGFTAAQTAEIEKLLHAGSGKFITSSSHRILKNRQWLIITPVSLVKNSVIVIEEEDKEITTADFKLKISSAENPVKIITDNAVAQFDASSIVFPLLLRRWKQGDYFYPLGMQRKKKVSRFLIDQKLSIAQKEKTWVLESNKKIIWIVGLRIDDRFKLKSSTKKIVEFRLISE